MSKKRQLFTDIERDVRDNGDFKRFKTSELKQYLKSVGVEHDERAHVIRLVSEVQVPTAPPSPDLATKVADLKKKGLSCSEISAKLGISTVKVWPLLNHQRGQ